jgi:hypothetical protein
MRFDAADRQTLAVAERLQRGAGRFAIACPHDRDRFDRREHPLVAGAGVVAMPVGDDGGCHRPQRIDVKAAGLAIEAGRRALDPGFGPRCGDRHGGGR